MKQSYEPKRYTIVTKELLLRLANEQQSKRRRRRVISDLLKITEIRLEYLNILNVDCLWPLTNLVKLKLNNNVIEKIENLESLTNLCELDFSFNRITKIENLEELKNIHILSFYQNEIEVVEGIDHMNYLTILSLGKNKINDLDHVLYLRKIKSLRSLQMAGNPCTERSGYVSYLIAFVPQLLYFGYKLISEKDRSDADEKHCRTVSNVLEEEEKRNKDILIIKEKEEKVAQLSVSYVEYLNDDGLFMQLYEHDEDGRELSQFTQDTKEAYDNYKKNFMDICYQLYELGLQEEARRREEINALNSVIDDLLTKATNRARKIMDSVHGKRVEITVRVTQLLREAALASDDVDLDDDAIDEIDKIAKELSQEFNNYASQVWTKLMQEETMLHEQIGEMSEMFELNIKDMVGAFLEGAQEYFSKLRELESEYSENLMPLAITHLNTIDEEDEKTPYLQNLVEDKDALNNALATSHFSHIQIIDDRQDRMVKRLNAWMERFLVNLVEDETERSRSRILEISHFIDYHRKNATVAKLLGQQMLMEEENENEEDLEIESKRDSENEEEDDD